jgi:hypothetical protein
MKTLQTTTTENRIKAMGIYNNLLHSQHLKLTVFKSGEKFLGDLSKDDYEFFGEYEEQDVTVFRGSSNMDSITFRGSDLIGEICTNIGFIKVCISTRDISVIDIYV